MPKKRQSVFDAVEALDTQDVQAEKKRKRQSEVIAKRSKATQSQTKIFNSLLECRILLQRCATVDNNDNNNNNNNNTATTSSNTRKECNELLTSLLQARSQLLPNNHDKDEDYYSKLVYCNDNDADDADNKHKDDDDDDIDNDSENNSKNNNTLETVLQDEYSLCRQEWKEVLNRRYKNIRLHSGITAKSQFKVLDSSLWQQIEATMEYENVRQSNSNNEQQQQSIFTTKNDNNNNNFFDDSKVYQQLLKAFVTSSSSSLDATNNNHYLKSKKKKKSKTDKVVDRKASKGRKIRYTEIPKLFNFTFPVSRPESSLLESDEWFQSLFGGVGTK